MAKQTLSVTVSPAIRFAINQLRSDRNLRLPGENKGWKRVNRMAQAFGLDVIRDAENTNQHKLVTAKLAYDEITKHSVQLTAENAEVVLDLAAAPGCSAGVVYVLADLLPVLERFVDGEDVPDSAVPPLDASAEAPLWIVPADKLPKEEEASA